MFRIPPVLLLLLGAVLALPAQAVQRAYVSAITANTAGAITSLSPH